MFNIDADPDNGNWLQKMREKEAPKSQKEHETTRESGEITEDKEGK